MFCAAVDLGSISRAARLLRVTQPAASKRIRTLEALVGAPLLERTAQGVSPTAEGAQLYSAARHVLAAAEELTALLAELPASDAPVRLAASPTMAEFVLPSLLVDLESRHERHLSVELSIANSREARRLVREGRADVGVVAEALEASDRLPVELPLCDDEVVVVVPKRHPWAKLDEIPLDDFAACPLIVRDPAANSRAVVDAAMHRLGRRLADPLAEIGSTMAAKSAALSECAPALLSRLSVSASDRGLLIRRVAGVRFERAFVIAHMGDQNLAAGARDLVSYLRAHAPQAITAGYRSSD